MNTKRFFLGAMTALALALAACAPGTDLTGTPSGTEDFGLTTPSLTEGAGTETGGATSVVSTPAATQAGAGTQTGAGTQAVSTPQATSAAGGATAVRTPAATTAAGTQTAEEPILIRAADLIGLEVMDSGSTSLGEVQDILVDAEGNVLFAVLDASGQASTGTGAGTPAAGSGTQTLAGRELVRVDWDMFQIEPGDEALTFTGTAADLQSMETIDETMFDEPGFLFSDVQSTTETTGEKLIRVGRFTDFDLRNTADEDLGEVEDLVVDLNAGMVENAIVEFGGFLGLGEKAVAVPWQQFQLDQTTPDQEFFLLDVEKETLEQAPQIENMDETLPHWPQPINPNWAGESDSFWESLS
jgi:sporulation protein YlmC with PRC-barrel domain